MNGMSRSALAHPRDRHREAFDGEDAGSNCWGDTNLGLYSLEPIQNDDVRNSLTVIGCHE